MNAGTEALGRQLQMISGAMVVAVLVFAGVAYKLAEGPAAGPVPAFPLLSLVAAGVAAVSLAIRKLVPSLTLGGMRAALAEADDNLRPMLLGRVYQSRTIVGMALLEGAAFFNIVAYLTEKRLWSYGVVLLLLSVMALTFPSQTKFESWADDIQRDL